MRVAICNSSSLTFENLRMITLQPDICQSFLKRSKPGLQLSLLTGTQRQIPLIAQLSFIELTINLSQSLNDALNQPIWR